MTWSSMFPELSRVGSGRRVDGARRLSLTETDAMSPERLAQVREELAARLTFANAENDPYDAPVCSTGEVAWLIDVMDRQEREIERLTREVTGYEKVKDLWNKGMESTCDDRDALKQEVRRLTAHWNHPVGCGGCQRFVSAEDVQFNIDRNVFLCSDCRAEVAP